MQFFDHPSCYEYTGLKMDVALFYNRLMASFDMRLNNERVSRNQCLTERDWWLAGRPYYNVYPGLVKYLINLKEDKVLTELIKLRVSPLCFRFAVNDETFAFDWKGKRHRLQSVLVGDYPILNNERAFTLWMYYGEMAPDPVLVYHKLTMSKDQTLEQAANDADRTVDENLHVGLQVPPLILQNAMRCILACCLLGEEDGLIVPEVLNRDKGKPVTEAILNRAKRYGKFGWNIGASVEYAPHWRGPSPFALYWTGPGRKIPRYRYRRGTIVHRNIVEQVPTGHLDGEVG